MEEACVNGVVRARLCALFSTHLQLGVHALGELLAVGLQQLGRGHQGLEVLLRADLPVPDGHQVAHDVHQARVVPVRHLAAQTLHRVVDEGGQVPHTGEERARGGGGQ